MKSSNRQGKTGGENMNISKDEIYQIVKETVEKRMLIVGFLIGCIYLISISSLFVGIINLNLRITIGSILAMLLAEKFSKNLKKNKEELIRKMVEEYDEKGI